MNNVNHKSVAWNRQKINESFQFIDDFYHVLLDRYGQIVEDFCGVKSSTTENQLIAGEWLHRFLHLIISNYELAIISQTSRHVSPIPIFSFTQNFTSELPWSALHNHIYSMVSLSLDSKVIKFEWTKNESNNVDFDSSHSTGLKRIAANRNSSLNIISFAHTKFCWSTSNLDRFTSMLKLRRWSNSLIFPSAVIVESADTGFRMHQYRNWDNVNSKLTRLQQLCLKLLPLYLPLELLEARASLREQAMSLGFKRTPFLFSNGGLHGHTLFKHLANEWRAEGSKLLYQQHGGGFGILTRTFAEDYERTTSDHFFTWGWSGKNKTTSTLRPGIKKTKSSNRLNHTLLVCVDMPKYTYQIVFGPMPNRVEKMVSQTETFLKNFKSEITVTPYHQDYGNKMKQRIFAANPDVKIELSGRSGPPYTKHSLIICNSLTTTWLEAIALGIPTIAFFDEDMHQIRPSAITIIDELFDVGILHNSAKRAAIFANDVAKSPYSWWRSSDVVAARQSLDRDIAGFRTDWLNNWEHTLTTFGA